MLAQRQIFFLRDLLCFLFVQLFHLDRLPMIAQTFLRLHVNHFRQLIHLLYVLLQFLVLIQLLVLLELLDFLGELLFDLFGNCFVLELFRLILKLDFLAVVLQFLFRFLVGLFRFHWFDLVWKE